MLYAESDKGRVMQMSVNFEGAMTSPGVYAYRATGSVAAMSREEIDHNSKVLEGNIKRAEGDYRKAKGYYDSAKQKARAKAEKEMAQERQWPEDEREAEIERRTGNYVRIHFGRVREDYEEAKRVLDKLKNTRAELEKRRKELEESSRTEQETKTAAEGQDRQGNPLNADGSLKVETVSSIDEITDEDFIVPMRNVQLPELSEDVAAAIGTDGKPIVIKKNILKRNSERHPDVSPSQSREILKAALYTPNLYGQNQRASHPYNWVLISVKGKDGRNKLVLLEVNHNKDFAEIVHWHFVEDRAIEKIKKQAEREGGQLLILPSVDTEEAGALSGRPSGSASESKGNIKSTEKHDDEINHYDKEFDEEVKGKPRDNGDTRARIVKFSDVSGTVDVKAVAAELQSKFGVEVEVVDSLDGVKNEQARKAIAAGQSIKGLVRYRYGQGMYLCSQRRECAGCYGDLCARGCSSQGYARLARRGAL